MPVNLKRRDGLPPSPPLPNVLQLMSFVRWPLGWLELLRRRYGPTFTLHLPANPPMVCLSDPEDARAVLNGDPDALHPGEGAAQITPIVGEQSFILADGATHLEARRKLTPAFRRQTADDHLDLIRTVAESEVADWPRDQMIPLYPRLRALALRIILEAIFGDGDARVDELHTRLLRMLSVVEHAVLPLKPARHVPPGRGVWRRFLREREAADQLISTLRDSRRAEHASGGSALDVLLDDGDPPSAGYARDTLMSVILAAHEMTAGTLAWTFQLLAHHPTVLARTITAIDRGEPIYLDAVIYEALRHRPVFVFAIPRDVVRSVEIGDRAFEPPARLLPCIHLIHHDPRFYEAPHEFRPERFLQAPPDPRTWLPWGGGRRRCPGRHLALHELRTVLQVVLSTVTVQPASSKLESAKWRSAVVTPRNGCRVVLRARHTASRVPRRDGARQL